MIVKTDIETQFKAILDGDRRALAQAITLIESTRSDHREHAETLLSALMPNCGDSVRVGISGAPGVGKSSFIETFGLHLVKEGHRVAVLAVDPCPAYLFSEACKRSARKRREIKTNSLL